MKQIILQGEISKIDEYEFIVPSLEDFIALKLRSVKYNPEIREYKDIPDIINLIRINKRRLTHKKVKELCTKYGSKDIFRTIWKN